jgi:predicted lactoylglutathione lyase
MSLYLLRREEVMMFDHVEYCVHSFENSLKFYSACLATLGYQLTFSNEKRGTFGFGTKTWTELLLTTGTPTTPRLYIAFVSTSEEQVQEFHRRATKASGTCNGAPGLRKDYSPGYYAAFVLDPDGHNIEALFRK